MDPVEWVAARTHLSALLDGTNPRVFGEILRVLVATNIDPEFARQMVRESSDLLLAHVGAEHERTREPAVAFLRAISGEDFGTVEAWTAWVNGQLGGDQANRPIASSISEPSPASNAPL